jgi:hypothetical protein
VFGQLWFCSSIFCFLNQLVVNWRYTITAAGTSAGSAAKQALRVASRGQRVVSTEEEWRRHWGQQETAGQHGRRGLVLVLPTATVKWTKTTQQNIHQHLKPL